MFRQAIVLAVAFSIAGACATPSIAKEPGIRVWETWCSWLDSLGVPRARPPRELSREELRSVIRFDPGPLMPVDYSYDQLVDPS